MRLFYTAICCILTHLLAAQSYDSYLTGSATDADVAAQGGICLMGGATEDDNAMTWFLQRANGGDVLVLRATGSDGYNDYFYTDLGVSLNSVETIIFNDASAASDAYVLQQIAEAEAIWFAGGDQYDYITYWRGTAVDSLINAGLQQRNIAIGGTSAGMAIQGGYIFTAQNGTVYSDEALTDPYNQYMTVDSTAFFRNDILADVITDTHYDDPDRKGRHVTFLARMLNDYGLTHAKGIALDEYTAACIAPDGTARIFGGFPTYDDNAYFLQVNCDLSNPAPESLASGTPLTWDHNGEAVVVYSVKGTASGNNTFDLNAWKTGNGGTWQYWSVQNGTLTEATGNAPDCTTSVSLSPTAAPFGLTIAPNPVSDMLTVQSSERLVRMSLSDATGRVVRTATDLQGFDTTVLVRNLAAGVYFLSVESATGRAVQRVVIE